MKFTDGCKWIYWCSQCDLRMACKVKTLHSVGAIKRSYGDFVMCHSLTSLFLHATHWNKLASNLLQNAHILTDGKGKNLRIGLYIVLFEIYMNHTSLNMGGGIAVLMYLLLRRCNIVRWVLPGVQTSLVGDSHMHLRPYCTSKLGKCMLLQLCDWMY